MKLTLFSFRFAFLVVVVNFLFLFSAICAQAEDIYIAQTAQGGATGVDAANAHSAAWFNTAGNWGAGAGKISAGDTVHLCGTITTALTAQGGGTAGTPVTIYFESGAKLSKPTWNGIALLLNDYDYITVDGGSNGIIENTDNGSAGSYTYQNNTQGIWATSCENLEVKNLTIRNMYVRTSTADTTASWSQVNCIYFSGSNVSIHDNVFDHAGGAVMCSYNDGDTEVRVYNNTMHDNAHNFVLSSGGDKHAGKVYFYNNHVYHYGTWDGAGCPYHNSAIHAYGLGPPWPDVDEFWIYNNLFEDPGVCSSGHVFMEGGARTIGRTPWTASTGTVYFFNNVVIGAQVQISKGQNHLIANNTFINSDTSLAIGDTTNPTIKNNYIAGATIELLEVSQATIPTPSTIDYNVYANYLALYNAWCWPVTGCTANWALHKTNCSSCDTHSYDDTTGYGGVNQSTGRPQVGSDVIDHGVNLSNLGIKALNSDKNGIARPQGSAWDIGAYEYTTRTPPRPPSPPSGLKIVP